MLVDKLNLTEISNHIKSGDIYFQDYNIQTRYADRRYTDFLLQYNVEKFTMKTKTMTADQAMMIMFSIAGKYFMEDETPKEGVRNDWFACTLSLNKSTNVSSIYSVHYIGNNINGLDKKSLIGSITPKTKEWLKEQFTNGSLIRNKYVVVKCQSSNIKSYNLNNEDYIASYLNGSNGKFRVKIETDVTSLEKNYML